MVIALLDTEPSFDVVISVLGTELSSEVLISPLETERIFWRGHFCAGIGTDF